MHSRIIEARDSKEELCGISEADFYENPAVEEFSDYIAALEYEDDPGDWLARRGLKWDADERSLTLVDKQAYFASKHEEFLESLEKLRTATLEQFSEGGPGLEFELWRARSSYDDIFSIHLYGLEYWGGNLCTLDDWVRSMKNGTRIYIGNMLDYHY